MYVPWRLSLRVTVVSMYNEFRGPPVGEEQAVSMTQVVIQRCLPPEFLLNPIKHHIYTSATALQVCVNFYCHCSSSTVMIKLNDKCYLRTFK